jgi:succinylglutamate desuccinylase
MSTIRHVLIAGGTHGNELVGVHAIRKFQRNPELVRRSSFETTTILANPEAVAAGRRYVDQDLNRAFASGGEGTRELRRAQKLRAEYGAQGRAPADFIIDQHGTTSNAGLMLILDNLDPFTLALAAHLCRVQPAVKLYSSAASGRSHDSLRSLAPYRIGIEVGPVAHGTLHAELFQQDEALVYAILDYLEARNLGAAPAPKTTLTLYQYVGAADYPRDERGELRAMVHPALQFRDYEPLAPGDPMFLSFDGETLPYEGPSTVYPVFINEAAYYEKGVAMCLTERQQIEV